jgi:hypothetical protein
MSGSINAIVVQPDGNAEIIATGSDLESLTAHLNGGWLEAISAGVDIVSWGWTGYCDEEGKIKGLPRNFVADDLAVSMGWLGRAGGDFLVGPVVFLGPPNDNGDDTSCPPEMISHFVEFYEERGVVEVKP